MNREDEFSKCISANFSRPAKQSAFTLAEVLITIGIIGIVAAMTIPGLITKIQNEQFRAAYRKAYSSLNQAMKYAAEDDGISLDVSTTTGFTSQCGEIFKYLSRYYNAKTTCFEKNADKCWVCEKGEAGSFSSNWLGCTKDNYAFIDASGIAYYLYYNNENVILIDVNGAGKPNQLGRDRFRLYFADSSNPKSTRASYIDAVLPADDIIGKQRWCPQGNCLYKSWIYTGK